MTPPVASGAGTLRRPLAPHAPRRKSGPTHPARRGRAGQHPSTAGQLRRRRWLIALPRLAARFAVALPDARALDRLIRGRAWIAIVACSLVGIVYLQVSLLGLNAGITRAVATAQTLETQNSMLQSEIAQAGAGGRVQDAAARAGMVMPPAAWASYLTAGRSDAAGAATSIGPPDPAAELRNAAQNAALQPPGALPTLSGQDAQTSSATTPAIAPSATAAAATAVGSGGPIGAGATPVSAAPPAPSAAAPPSAPPAPTSASTSAPTSSAAVPTAAAGAPTPSAAPVAAPVSSTSTSTSTGSSAPGSPTGGVSPTAAGPG